MSNSTFATRPSRRRWPFVVVGVALLSVVAVAVVLWTNDGQLLSPQRQERSIGLGITVQSDIAPSDLKAAVSRNAPSLPAATIEPSWITPAAPNIELTPAGALPAPLTFTVPLTAPLANDEVLVARVNHSQPFDAADAETTPVQVSPDRRSALVTLDHLSGLEVFKVSRNVVSSLLDQFVEDAFSGAFSEAKSPTCANQTKAEAGSYSFTPKSNIGSREDAVQWCYGYAGTDRIIKATNNRRYPVEVDLGRFGVIDSGDLPVSMVEAYRLNHPVIMPRETMTFVVNPLNPGTSTSLSSRGSNWGVGLTVVDAAAKAFLVLTAGVLGKSTEGSLAALKAGRLTLLDAVGLQGVKFQDFMSKIFEAQSCKAALESNELNVPKVISECFTEDSLTAAAAVSLGFLSKIRFALAVAAFVAVSSAAFAIIGMPRVLANFFADKTNGRDRYTITASRGKSLPAAVVGEWTRHSTGLVIKSDGTGTFSTRLYATCTADPADDCDIDTVLSFAVVDGTHVRAMFKSVSYISWNTGTTVSNPVASVDQFYRPGDTMLIHVDQYHRLITEDEGRLNNDIVDDLGVRADTQFYCGPQTDPNQTMLCGA